VLGIKSHPLDDGEVPLFMSCCSWHRGGTKVVVSFGLKLEKKHDLQLQNQARESRKPTGCYKEKERNQPG
jgi:hypothetical protein